MLMLSVDEDQSRVSDTVMKLDKAIGHLEAIIATGAHGQTNCSLLQRWRRQTPSKERSGVLREASMMAFLNKHHDTLQSQRQVVLEAEQTQYSDSKYEPFDVVVAKEGGNDAALSAARKYCQKCMALKGRWIRYNKWTERVEYLYSKIGITEALKRRFVHTVHGDNALKDLATKTPGTTPALPAIEESVFSSLHST